MRGTTMSEMMIKGMATTGKVHWAKEVKGGRLEQICGISPKQRAYLAPQDATVPVDCKRCLAIQPDTPAKEEQPARGGSRAGTTMSVPRAATGKAKAEVVRDKLPVPATVTVRKGQAMLRAMLGEAELRLVWDADGRYMYGESCLVRGGKERKLRNVSEALRLLAS